MKKAVVILGSEAISATEQSSQMLLDNLSEQMPDFDWRVADLAQTRELIAAANIAQIMLTPGVHSYQAELQQLTTLPVVLISGVDFIKRTRSAQNKFFKLNY